MTVADPRAELLNAMAEKQWQQQVEVWLRRGNWIYYHTHDSRKSAPGFPDIIAIHPERRVLLVAELKTNKGRLGEGQSFWLGLFRLVDACVFVWRPSMWREVREFLCGTEPL